MLYYSFKTTLNFIENSYCKTKIVYDENDRLKELSELGDPLEKLNKYIQWENFRGILKRTLEKEAKGPGGRPPYDYVMMFKILILQKMYNMADDKTEYLINNLALKGRGMLFS